MNKEKEREKKREYYLLKKKQGYYTQRYTLKKEKNRHPCKDCGKDIYTKNGLFCNSCKLVGDRSPFFIKGKPIRYTGRNSHRKVMEIKLGRNLNTTEIVHHINKIKNDNRVENLMLFRSRSAHVRWHAYLKRYNLPNLMFDQPWLNS